MEYSTSNTISLEELYQKYKIKWSNFFAIDSGNLLSFPEQIFEVEPNEYLNFAKNNLEINNRQNCIDGITNIKRAIDSQIDLLISNLGYDFKAFDNQNIFVKNFINSNYKGDLSDGITSKLKLLNILGLAPTCLISNIRNIRNQVEHQYIVPQYKYLKESLEIAELFINSSSMKFSLTSNNISICNELVYHDVIIMNSPTKMLKPPFFDINLNGNTEIGKTSITVDLNSSKSFAKLWDFSLTPKDEFYAEILSIFFNKNFSILPRIFNCTIDEKYLKCTYVIHI